MMSDGAASLTDALDISTETALFSTHNAMISLESLETKLSEPQHSTVISVSSEFLNTTMIESINTTISLDSAPSIEFNQTTEVAFTPRFSKKMNLVSTAIALYNPTDATPSTEQNVITTYAPVYVEGMLPCSIVPSWYSIMFTIRPIDDIYSIVYECESGYEFADEYVRRYSVCSEELMWQPPISVCQSKCVKLL